MRFSIVIPTINQYAMLFHDCIDSFIQFHGDQHEIIVVDDGSDAKLQMLVEGECRKRGIKFLANEQNSGFSKTVNKGIKAASGDVVILVNNDVRFTQDVLTPIQKSFGVNEKIGIVGALLFYPHGTIQHGGIMDLGKGAFTHRGWHKMFENAPEVHKAGYLIAVTGALFAIRKTMVEEVGYLNENYFLSCEDSEYCLQAWTKDWKVYYNPEIKAIHAEGVTRGANDKDKLVKNRVWYIKERQTMSRFQNDSQRFDWDGIRNKVAMSNVDIPGHYKPSQGICEKKSYGSSSALKSGKPLGDASKVIAVRRTGALGDVILTTGVIRKLRQTYPDHQIWYATVCPDVLRDNPNITKVVRTMGEIPSPEMVFDLDLAYESSPKIPMIEAYANKVFGKYDFDGRPEMFSSDRDFNLLRSKLPTVNFSTDRIAILHMAVGWDSRTWSRQKWCEVTNGLSSGGFKTVVIGRGADHRSDLFGGVVNAVDHLTVHEIREMMKRASVFCGMDSGMFHVAMTTDCPAVGLFTVANPDFRIAARDARTTALVPNVPCRYCLHDQPAPVTFVACKYGTNHCLNDFSPSAVAAAIQEIAR